MSERLPPIRGLDDNTISNGSDRLPPIADVLRGLQDRDLMPPPRRPTPTSNTARGPPSSVGGNSSDTPSTQQRAFLTASANSRAKRPRPLSSVDAGSQTRPSPWGSYQVPAPATRVPFDPSQGTLSQQANKLNSLRDSRLCTPRILMTAFDNNHYGFVAVQPRTIDDDDDIPVNHDLVLTQACLDHGQSVADSLRVEYGQWLKRRSARASTSETMAAFGAEKMQAEGDKPSMHLYLSQSDAVDAFRHDEQASKIATTDWPRKLPKDAREVVARSAGKDTHRTIRDRKPLAVPGSLTDAKWTAAIGRASSSNLPLSLTYPGRQANNANSRSHTSAPQGSSAASAASHPPSSIIEPSSQQTHIRTKYIPRILMTTKTVENNRRTVDFVPCLPCYSDGSGYVWSNGDSAEVSESRQYSAKLAESLKRKYFGWTREFGLRPLERNSMASFAVHTQQNAKEFGVAQLYVPDENERASIVGPVLLPDWADEDESLRLPEYALQVAGFSATQKAYTTPICKDREIHDVNINETPRVQHRFE